MATVIHPIAAESASCYALLAMRCGNTICVAAVPSSKHSYRCIHETFHQLQACGRARSRREAKPAPRRETVEVAEKLRAGPGATPRSFFKKSAQPGALVFPEPFLAHWHAPRHGSWRQCSRGLQEGIYRARGASEEAPIPFAQGL